MNLGILILGPSLLVLAAVLAASGGSPPVWAGAAWAAVSAAWGLLMLHAAVSAESRVFGPSVSRGAPGRKAAALTFDDGPNEPHTSRLLDVLKERGVKATFFLVGENAEACPEIVKRMVSEGHAVGGHGYGHRPWVLCSRRAIEAEIDSGTAALEKITGRGTKLLRVPFGWRDPRVFSAAKARGLTVVQWSVAAKDDFTGERQKSPERIADRVLRSLHPGAIILMHDGSLTGKGVDKSASVEAAPRIIDGLKSRGYELVTVPGLLGLD